jgi:hypothetical protein
VREGRIVVVLGLLAVASLACVAPPPAPPKGAAIDSVPDAPEPWPSPPPSDPDPAVADFSGEWNTLTGRGTAILAKGPMVLVQNGTEVEGRYANLYLGAWTTDCVLKGTVSGNRLSFTTTGNWGGKPAPSHGWFELKGDAFAGKYGLKGESTHRAWEGTRTAPGARAEREEEAATADATEPSAPPPEPTSPEAPSAPAPRDERVAERTFVLVVGCNDYADEAIPNLRFAENDARDVFAFYATDAKSPTSRDRVQIIAGKAATRRAVLGAIREHLTQKATGPGDAAVLYFAGHGFSDADETYLACHDTELAALMETAIALSTLETYWKRIGAGTKVLITDACHSGGLANLRGLTVRRKLDAGTSPVSAVIAAAGPNQVSAEDEELGKGIFTTVLLNGLRGNADADGSGKVTLPELQRFLVETVPGRAREVQGNQTPVVQVHGPGQGVALTR